MTAKEIRQAYMDYFKSKAHTIVPSAPIVIKNDPTLLFTNAGMNQFKDAFLGNAEAIAPRVADSQKCLRVSGKHNDLEEVGHDTYHHTMFEMLGNWSFGDYFKEDAIAWAWELLTDVFKLDKDRIYITVFEGDEGEGLASDDDARKYWLKWVSEDRILNGNKKDNFWEMGDQGPCGPSSEIHFDLRPQEDRDKVDGKSLVNMDHPEVVEIWNLVFMEFNRKADGSLERLPAQHVDTGMGFERLCMVIQGVRSNYDTDVFTPIISEIEKHSGVVKTRDHKSLVAMRVIADHIRAIAFAIADGQLPSNNGAGYVIRRILRRATRYAYSVLDMNEPFMFKLVDVLDREMGEFFPEIRSQRTLVESVIQEEESAFLRTLEQGLKRLDDIISQTQGKVVDGAKAFELYDTFGFPVDLTSLILREKEMDLDQAGFDEEMAKQKSRSRAATKMSTDDWVEIRKDAREEFIGYDRLDSTVHVAKYREVRTTKKNFYQVVLDHTPFYPEGGGQVGDKGWLSAGDEKIRVWDTKKETGMILHYVDELPERIESALKAEVESDLRRLTANNHSATHLLHEALREVLGTHVEQKGSLVNEEHLRFDFSHFQKVSESEIRQVEDLVNGKIRQNLPLEEFRNIAMEDAKDMGAMALFGEKYGDTVRAIKFGSSIELCGGTHVSATGQIGFFKIVSEGAVAAGVRRIEALTSEAADQWLRDQIDKLHAIQAELKASDPLAAVKSMKAENSDLKKALEAAQKEMAGNLKEDLLKAAEVVNGVRFIAQKVDLDAGAIKDMAFQLKAKNNDLFMLLATEGDGKVQLHLLISDALVKDKGLNAGSIVREIAKHVKGGGGGAPFFATAGGKDAGGIQAAFEAAKSYI
ncbi:alanine--tRNA ligase [Phaeocystidibacter marisrubri]|uniref:Alanine--tRNA ligase n=1 Tax=Phaeocystidibacter marisrubri TaxID=1577780 RepID=A0A6L3ZL49_9FLAO|nr:alanine--tRNA ligase [Phaeocystidibacter marisrubri]KAB2818205.1 alanine--tRNA ligase [Phaeocystidibacter marisrubri]